MIRKLLVFIVFSAVAVSTFADTLKTEKEAKQLAEKVMELVAKGDVAAAFNALKPFAAISENELQGMALQSKAQRDQYGARFGNSVGYELVCERKLGTSLQQFVFIEKTETHALPWMFVFYKSPTGWMLNSFTWSDQLSNAFQSCAD